MANFGRKIEKFFKLNGKLPSKQNKIAKEIGLAQKNKESIEDLKSMATKISSELKDAKDKFQTNKIEYEDFLLNIPNLLDPSVPFGKSAEDNEVLKEAGMISSFDLLQEIIKN